jgi:ribosomal protein S18 acetylase RimI-like enzyme
MSVEVSLVSDLAEVRALEEEWAALARAGGSGALFRSLTWLQPWWHAYRQVLGAELMVLLARQEGQLIGIAPLYRRVARLAPAVKVREVRLIGDAGPRPPALDLLVEPGHEERVGTALGDHLVRSAAYWDVIDLEPLREPARARAFMANRLNAAGLHVESFETGGARRIALAVGEGEGPGVVGRTPLRSDSPDRLASAYVSDLALLRKGMSALRRLSRLEWGAREEHSPLCDAEAQQLLEEVALQLGMQGKARLARLDDASEEAIAAALVVDDGDRAVVLAMAIDPEYTERAAVRLLTAEAQAAAERGCVALDVVTGAGEYPMPQLPCSRQCALNLRAYSHSPAAAVARTYSGLRRRVSAARDAQGAAAAGARAAWAKIRGTASHVAGYQRLHLYRGELWTRGVPPTSGLVLGTFSEADFDALSDYDREDLVDTLQLDEAYCRAKWQRGDLAVLARLVGRPAGIAWCARSAVEVPELGRMLVLGPAEAYIHDVFVAPQARGRAVAPSMLEFLAGELRQRDVYRSWALIGSDNAASVRAFEKAAYAAVADVIYARMGHVDRMVVRPPDPEARQLLGLS